MIIDLEKFISSREPEWKELERMLELLDKGRERPLEIREIKRLHYLYGKVSDDLVKISTFSGEREIRKYLETLVSRAFGLIHDSDKKIIKFSPRSFIMKDFPETFRKNARMFWIAFTATLIGTVFGFLAPYVHLDAKEAIFPAEMGHLQMSPEKRVDMEESSTGRAEGSARSNFAVFLFTHNIKVSVLVLSLGISFGLGTVMILFYNGIMLGAVFSDFIFSGYSLFVLGWLLPHGVIEIPSILIAGQAGLVMGTALLKPSKEGRIASLRAKSQDISNLALGAALLLVWAGIVESFFSQFHWPVVPYWFKISFAVIEFILLVYYLAFAGKAQSTSKNMEKNEQL